MPVLSDQLRDVFLDEIERQCVFAINAVKAMQKSLGGPNGVLPVWYHVQAFLVSVGNLSKILWPPDERIKGRGKELRDLLGVLDTSAVAVRDFRNHFEHYDERIERWATESVHQNMADSNIMPPGAIVGLDPKDFLRNLDPTTGILSFRGDTYDIPRVAKEVDGILGKARSLLGARGGSPRPPSPAP